MKTILSKLLLSCLLLPLSILAQTVTGVVTDENKMPMPGVNVIVKSTKNGTSTDFDGKYTLSKLKKGDVIEYSYVGYATKDVTYNNEKTLNVSLSEDNQQLKEVVLVSVGYGTVKKKDATGSVSLLSSKDFNKGAVSSGSDLLQGKVAGVTINTGGGSPGSVGQIRIRGGSSLDSNNDPLLIIDGLPMSDPGVLNRINPNDIETFSVLKDASATAIYGVRASNGVILVTTKRGGKKLEVDYNFQYGSGKRFNKVGVMNASQFREAYKKVLQNNTYPSQTNTYYPINTTTNQREFNENLISNFLGTADTDWQEEVLRRTDFVDNNLSIKGSLFGKVPARLTLGNTYQEGLLLTDYMNRNTINVALNPSFFDNHLKFNINFNYAHTSRRSADVGQLGAATRMAPTVPVYKPGSAFNGYFEYMTNPANINSFVINSIANPVAALNDLYNTSKNQRLFGNFELDYKFHFLPELRWVTNVGYDKDWGYGSRIRDARTRTGEREGQFIGENTFSDGQSVNTLLDSYFNYNNSKNENFKYDATLGYSYQKFTGDEFTTGNINIPTNITNPRFFRDDLVYIGFFGRLNFTVKDKYLVTMSLRRDGTSRFSEDNRWGYFPAASIAWKLKNEFFKDSNTVSDLKLRAGWGVNGQQDIGGIGRSNLIYLSQYLQGTDTSSYVFGGQYINPAFPQGFNPDITWEKTATFNAGLDFGLFNSRLSGSIDAFMKKSTDLLQRAPFADGTNFTNNGPQNVGEMTTKGLELTINYDVIKSENMNWNVNFNATTFERRIDKLASEIVQTGESVGSFGQAQAHVEGYAPNSFWVFKQLYDTTGKPLQGSFADVNGDGNYDAKDRYLYRNPDPKLILGFTSNFNYKNLDFSFNLRSNLGNRVLNTISALNSNYARIYDVTPTNLNLSVYNTNFANNVENQAFSDMFVENASFLRMDWATIGYTFPKWLEGKASLRIFTSVQNPFIITNYSGLDPEIVNGIDRGIFPRQRQFLLGCNVKF